MNDNKKTSQSQSSTAVKRPNTAEQTASNTQEFAFGTTNYILLAVGIVLLGLGYVLLSGGGSDDPNVFNPAMFDKRRLVVAPLLIVIGLVVEICAIMFRSKKQSSSDDQKQETNV